MSKREKKRIHLKRRKKGVAIFKGGDFSDSGYGETVSLRKRRKEHLLEKGKKKNHN